MLVDCGMSGRQVLDALCVAGLDPADLKALLITHEHSDHCKALKSFKNARQVKVFANRLTAESIQYLEPDTKKLKWQVFENGSPFDFCGIKVTAFSIPHDTSDAVGYKFGFEGRNLVWMTDLGKLTHLARDMARQAHILVLESNYCPKMLENSNRPYSLKQRIKSPHGHLSNLDALELLKSLDPSVVEKIYLAHISKECNSVSRISELLCDAGGICSHIEIVPPFSVCSTPLEF